ncbi:NAD(P)-dependent oxidoreductase [Kitasatospora azatica]|uniref:NAD(P)-dependent oxidoreductase n=1 Tax=Kitasatospora azatica TaxID=58347 RepID=UPI00056C10DD|nr:NAD(P)-dependent oxidoreductase [Kitasatospora azatica]
MSAPTVAVLGTGIMGAGMARSLRRAGLEVRVWNRTAARAQPLAEAGALVAADPAEAVRGAQVVITMLTDGPAALAAIQAAAEGVTEGQIWLQTSTVGVAGFAELADFAATHGLDLVDAPVLGTRQPAESGQLLVFAAGSERAREQAAEVLSAIAARTVWLGEDAAAATATRLKLVVNSWVLATVTGAAEALALAEGLGLDPRLFPQTIAGGGLDSGYLQGKSAAMLSGDFTPNFGLATAAKDARLILAEADAAGLQLDLATAVAERFERAVKAGHGEKDLSATYLVS